MRSSCLILLMAPLLAACHDPTDNSGEQTCKSLDQLNLGATRIAVSALHGPIRLSTLNGTFDTPLLLGNVNTQAWSPAGDRLVYVDDRGSDNYALSIADTAGVSRQLPVPLSSTWPAWSQDDWIYFFVQNGSPLIYRIRADGTALSAPLASGAFPAPSPDGQRMAYVNGIQILIMNLATGVTTPLASTSGVIDLRWSPDGKWIAYIENGQTFVISPDGLTKRPVGPTSVGGISWSGNSCYLLSGSQSSNMSLIDAAQGTFLNLPISGLYPAWKP